MIWGYGNVSENIGKYFTYKLKILRENTLMGGAKKKVFYFSAHREILDGFDPCKKSKIFAYSLFFE